MSSNLTKLPECNFEPINAEFSRCTVHDQVFHSEEFKPDYWGSRRLVTCRPVVQSEKPHSAEPLLRCLRVIRERVQSSGALDGGPSRQIIVDLIDLALQQSRERALDEMTADAAAMGAYDATSQSKGDDVCNHVFDSGLKCEVRRKMHPYACAHPFVEPTVQAKGPEFSTEALHKARRAAFAACSKCDASSGNLCDDALRAALEAAVNG